MFLFSFWPSFSFCFFFRRAGTIIIVVASWSIFCSALLSLSPVVPVRLATLETNVPFQSTSASVNHVETAEPARPSPMPSPASVRTLLRAFTVKQTPIYAIQIHASRTGRVFRILCAPPDIGACASSASSVGIAALLYVCLSESHHFFG